MLKYSRRQREEKGGSRDQGGAASPLLKTPEKSNGGGRGGILPGSAGAKGSGEEKIFVTVRVRPLSAKEVVRGDLSDWECSDEHTIIFKQQAVLEPRSPCPTSSYSFDRVFGPNCPTQQVYEEGGKDVALSVLKGLNSTIFAYGQTSSGKTYTMRGVTEAAVRDIYNLMEQNRERSFVLKVSALEIYNEIVKDLLNPDSGPLRLLDDPDRGTVVERLQEEAVRDLDHLRQILHICEAQRQVGETTLNDTSSRSHQIIRLTVESTSRVQDASTLIASLNFVDLAGSERASQTQAEGTRLKEGCHINRSLLTLSTCIRKLSVGGKGKGHIPYRDSKLTRILQHSLGGNARTAIICTICPARTHVEQTRNTLFFATRAKEVTNSARVNLIVSDKALVKQLQREVARLEAELRQPDSPLTSSSSAEALLQAKEEQIRKMEEDIKEAVRQRDAAQARLDEVTQKMLEAEKQAEKRQRELEQQAKELQVALESPCRPQPPTQGQLPPTPSACESDNSRALVVVRRNLADDLEGSQSIRPKGSSLKLNSASMMLVQEIRKLERLQDELGEDATRALEALQKEVECLRLAQAGMNADAAQTIKKLQEEVRNAHALRQEGATAREADGAEPQLALALLDNDCLKGEITRLRAMGDKDGSEACATIATLEEKLESVQKSLDKLLVQGVSLESVSQADEDVKTPSRRKKATPQKFLEGSSPCSPLNPRRKHENNENTPPRGGREVNASPTALNRKTPVRGALDDGPMNSKENMHRRSNSVDIRKMQNLFKTAAEDNIKSIRAYVTELKERVAKLQYQKQLLVCQVLELEANNPNNQDEAEPQDVAPLIPWSPSAWRKQYEKQRRTIIELWEVCHVSIIHRTQFYLLFKGDPADAIYLEVELRRLNWLQESSATAAFEAGHSGYQSEDSFPNSSPLSAGVKNLRKEREMLAKRMRSRLTADEREELFHQWNIPIEAKQRKLHLCTKIWTDPYDVEHVQASAEVVARIVGFWEPGNAVSKEMFELNFAPQEQMRHPLVVGWNQFTNLLNI